MQVGVFMSLTLNFYFYKNPLYRKAKAADPTNWPNFKYEYSLKTLTSMLQLHIQRHHLLLFQDLVKKNRWRILLPCLVSEARSQASTVNSTQDEQPDLFDESTFHCKLLNFVIADDQVGIFHLPSILLCLYL